MLNGYPTEYILPSDDNDHPLITCSPTPEREDAQIKRICIIGAGAAGLAALKIIIDTRQYKAGLWKPVVFEARDNVGGIW